MEHSRLKILIIAHEFSPIKGSESAVGWNIVTRLSTYHDVTVFYASGSQFRNTSYVEVIDEYFQKNPPIDGLKCINIDKPLIFKLIAKLNFFFRKLTPIGLPPLYYWGYKHWQKFALKKAKEMHKLISFDIVHQLTQITFREPGYMWRLDIPFIWGPTGGTATFPKAFRKELSVSSKILAIMRSMGNRYQFRFVKRIRKANKKAAVIYTFSKSDADRLRKKANGKVKIMLDVGTYPHSNTLIQSSEGNKLLKGIWCGRLSEYKAPDILLKALGLSDKTKNNIKFIIIGKGPLEKPMSDLAKKLGLYNIEWIKEVSHEKVFELMGESDFFVHTSIQEATSSVITEALTMRLPVICHDAFGMSTAIDETCGIKIPFISPEESIKGFHHAMESLILSKDLLYKLKDGAQRRSAEISWDIMAETIAADYTEIVNRHRNQIAIS